jgi:hypothetical protein
MRSWSDLGMNGSPPIGLYDVTVGWSYVDSDDATAFFGVAERPDVARVELVARQGARYSAEVGEDRTFFVLQDEIQFAPLEIRAYDAQGNELSVRTVLNTPADAPLPTPTTVPFPSEIPATATPLPTPTGSGTLLCDVLNGFSLTVPEGQGDVPDPGPATLMGTTTIRSHTEEEIMAAGQGQNYVPPDALAIDIFSETIPPGTFDAWVLEVRETTEQGNVPVTQSAVEPIEVAGYQGVTYTIEAMGYFRVVYLPTREDKVIRIWINPADSTALDQGFAILSTLRDGPCE